MKRKLSLVLAIAITLMFALNMNINVHAQDTITIWLTGDDTGAAILQEVAAGWTKTSGKAVTVTAVGWGAAYAQA